MKFNANFLEPRDFSLGIFSRAQAALRIFAPSVTWERKTRGETRSILLSVKDNRARRVVSRDTRAIPAIRSHRTKRKKKPTATALALRIVLLGSTLAKGARRAYSRVYTGSFA